MFFIIYQTIKDNHLPEPTFADHSMPAETCIVRWMMVLTTLSEGSGLSFLSLSFLSLSPLSPPSLSSLPLSPSSLSPSSLSPSLSLYSLSCISFLLSLSSLSSLSLLAYLNVSLLAYLNVSLLAYLNVSLLAYLNVSLLAYLNVSLLAYLNVSLLAYLNVSLLAYLNVSLLAYLNVSLLAYLNVSLLAYLNVSLLAYLNVAYLNVVMQWTTLLTVQKGSRGLPKVWTYNLYKMMPPRSKCGDEEGCPVRCRSRQALTSQGMNILWYPLPSIQPISKLGICVGSERLSDAWSTCWQELSMASFCQLSFLT